MHDLSNRSKTPAAFAIAFAILVWGGSFVAARHLLKPPPGRTALDPLLLAAVRFSIASLVFAIPFAAALLRRAVTGRDLLRMVFLGQIAFSTYYWLQYTGVQKTNAGIASILVVGLLPSAIAVLAPLAGEKRPPFRSWIALLVGFLGVAILALEKPLEVSSTGAFVLGAACLVANAFGFAVYSILSRRWLTEVKPFTLTAGGMIFGTLGLIAMTTIADPGGWATLKSLDGIQWTAILYLSLACSVFGYLAWNFALSRIEASRASVWIYAEPVIALALGMSILGERYGWTAFAGTAAIAASVIVVTVQKRG